MLSDENIREILELIEKEAKRELEEFKKLELELRKTISEVEEIVKKAIEKSIPEGLAKQPIKVKTKGKAEKIEVIEV